MIHQNRKFHSIKQIQFLTKIIFKSSEKPHELFVAFSVYRNGAKLFDTKRKESPNVLHCLSGLRTFAMIHIMFGHRYVLLSWFPNINARIFDPDGKFVKTFVSVFATVYHIPVDTFLVIGGLLLTLSILRSIERFFDLFNDFEMKLIEEIIHRKNFNIPKLYLHRYLRVMPVLSVLILIILSIFKFLDDGPMYRAMSAIAINPCKNHWWSALLHVQNYVNPGETVS
jgi:peptidoglycan/LPS O-acetylase OafA/YrhL